MFSTTNPFNKYFLSKYDYFSEPQVNTVLNESHNAFKVWSELPVGQRVDFIKTLVFALTKNQHLLSEKCTVEMGKPVAQSIAEVKKCALLCQYYIDNAEHFLQPKMIVTDAAVSYARYDPLGVILGVMPWNFPYWQVFRFAIPAIIAGNTVVVKHASNVAGCGILLEELFREAGFPEGIYSNLLISGEQVEAVINDPIIKAVSLTGSEKAGAAVASAAAKQIKKAVLELGGSNAFIVCEDADVEDAIAVAVNARMQNTGQSCIAAKRFLVHDTIYDVFLEGFKKGVEGLKPAIPWMKRRK